MVYLCQFPINQMITCESEPMKNIISRIKDNKTGKKKKSSTDRNREDTVILRARIQDKLTRPTGRNRG